MGKKLLVADDSLTIQKVIKLALSGDVYDIQTVSDGNDALQQISVFHPDAVLIDVGIPGRSAFEVKKAMNEDSDFRNIPVILMSSAFEKVDEAKVALLQFEGRLTKPFDPTHLRQALTQALSLREAYPPSSAASSSVREEPSLVFTKEAPSHAAPPRPRETAATPPPVREVAPLSKTPPVTKPAQTAQPARPAAAAAPSSNVSRELPEDERTKTFQTFTNAMGSNSNSDANSISLDFGQDSDPFGNSALPAEIELPELEPLSFGMNEESDIKHLTESTVRMSSLDEYDSWNIGEGSKAPTPAIDIGGGRPAVSKPVDAETFLAANKLNFGFGNDGSNPDAGLEDLLPPKFDHTRSIQNIAPTRTNLEFTNQRLGNFSNEAQSAPPIALEPFPELNPNPFGNNPFSATNFSSTTDSNASSSANPYGSLAADPSDPPAPSTSGAAPTQNAAANPVAEAPASRESIEAALNGEEMQARISELVRAEVARTLETMAKKGLPDIAEKVIRQEIRRILESLS